MLLNTVPLTRSGTQNVQTGHHGDLRQIKHVKQIKSCEVYDKWY